MKNIAKFERVNLRLTPGTKIISAEDYCEYKQASDIVSAAINHAEKVEGKSKSAYEIEEEYGYQEGLERANNLFLERHVSVAAKAVQALAELEQNMVHVVTRAVEKIVGEMDEDKRIRGVLSQLMAQTKDKHKLILRVNVDAVHSVQNTILNASEQAWESIDVRGDASLDTDSFVLETISGVIDGSIKTQIQILTATLTNIFNANQ